MERILIFSLVAIIKLFEIERDSPLENKLNGMLTKALYLSPSVAQAPPKVESQEKPISRCILW